MRPQDDAAALLARLGCIRCLRPGTEAEVAMQSVAVPQRHLLVWRDSPSSPFMWYGLLPLLALALAVLFAFGPFARTSIEAAVQRETRDQLNAAGFGWVGLSVSGQN